MFGLVGVIFVGPAENLGEALTKIVWLLAWLIPAIACIGVYWALQNVSDYPKSTKKLDERIAKLKDKLSGSK